MNMPKLIQYIQTYESLKLRTSKEPCTSLICRNDKMFLEFIYRPVDIDCFIFTCADEIWYYYINKYSNVYHEVHYLTNVQLVNNELINLQIQYYYLHKYGVERVLHCYYENNVLIVENWAFYDYKSKINHKPIDIIQYDSITNNRQLNKDDLLEIEASIVLHELAR